MAKKRAKQLNGGGEQRPHRMSLKDIIDRPAEQTAIVKVPEFGIDENGDAWEIIVRGMTVQDKHMMTQVLRKNGVQEEFSMAIVVALCAIDDDGQLVFGETRSEAIETVYALPERHNAAIARLCVEILRLTGQRPDANGQPVGADVAVQDAEKN